MFLTKIFENCKKYPERTALRKKEQKMTYGELLEKAASLMDHFDSLEIKKSEPVMIISNDAFEMVPAMLALFASGRVFVPVDPSTPHERLGEMTKTIDAKHIFRDPFKISSCKKKIETTQFDPDAPAYVYFTSGSTGKPKAISGNLAGIDHFINWQKDEFGFTENVVVSNLTNLSYDASMRDIFLPLTSGGTMSSPPAHFTKMGVVPFIEWMESEKINVLHTVPSIFRSLLIDHLKSFELKHLSHIFLAGEILHPKDFGLWLQKGNPKTKIINLYGPTETVMTKTFHVAKSGDENRKTLPIGKPLRDVKISILDTDGSEITDGRIGEIIIHTPFKLLGTFGSTETSNQFSTGDFGRWIEDGNLLEFLGRKDNLVKINGQRVHLSEIESAFKELSGLKDFAVIAHQEEMKTFIAAFLVLEADKKLNEIKETVQEKLPSYMQPSVVITMDELPRTISGKIDKKALIRKYEDNKKAESDAGEFTRDIVLSQLIDLWKKHLKIENIRPSDNFFSLGGDSLMSVSMIVEVEELFNRKVGVAPFLENPTVLHLKKLLSDKESFNSIIVKLSPPGKMPLWLIHPPGGNVAAFLELSRNLSDKHTVYAVQDPFYIGKNDILRLEDVARFYADEMMKVQGTGPFYIGGWSMGGIIAHAVADELLKRKKDIAWLFMLDSDFPYNEDTGLNIINSFFFNFASALDLTYDAKFQHHLKKNKAFDLIELQYGLFTGRKISRKDLERLSYLIPLINQILFALMGDKIVKLKKFPLWAVLKLPISVQRRILFQVLKRAEGLGEWAKSKEFENFLIVLNKNLASIMDYKPSKIACKIYHFKCLKIIPTDSIKGLDLSEVTSDEVRVTEAYHDHFTFMKGASGRKIAEVIKSLTTEG